MNKDNIQWGIQLLEERGMYQTEILPMYNETEGEIYEFYNENSKERILISEKELELLGKVDVFMRGK